MLVNLKQIISMAEDGGYCVPAFNVYNIETVMGVIKAAEEQRAPVIIQVYPRLINEEVGYYLAPVILAAAKKATVPVCFHLDHGPSELEAQKILYWGATGIMYDGSVHPLEENIANTKHIVEICNAGIHGAEYHSLTAVVTHMRVLGRIRGIHNSLRPHSAISAFVACIVKFKHLQFRPDLRHSLLLVHDHSLRDVAVHDCC